MTMQRQLETFRDLRPQLQLLAEYLQAHMRLFTEQLEIYPILMGRAKSLESFAEKTGRKGKHYADPLLEMTDLCGVRVIVHILKQAQSLAEAVVAAAAKPGSGFRIDQANCENKAALLDVKSFGYLSDHYILVLDHFPAIEGFDDVNKLQRLTGLRQTLAASGGQLRAELQIRTLAQHIWADIYHELGYKNEFQLPQRWERQFARVAAQLEGCDKSFQDISDAMMGTYDPSYSAFMERSALGKLARTLETVLQVMDSHDKGFVKTAHRLLKTYIALGDTALLVDLLAKHETVLASYAPALRDMGVALCQIHKPGTDGFRHGQSLLEQAVERNPSDTDARCSLAGSYRKENDSARRELARQHYRGAHRLEPSNPYPLGNYIAEELQAVGDAHILDYFHSAIAEAMRRCEKQIEVRINLPWAYFDLGLFELYLQRPGCRFLHHYARGIASATQDWMLRSAHTPIDAMRRRGIQLQGIDLLGRLLNLGWWVKTPAAKRRAVDAAFPQPDPQCPRLTCAALRAPVVIVAGWGEDLTLSQVPLLAALRAALSGFEGTLVSGGTATGVSGLVAEAALSKPGEIGAVGCMPRTQKALADPRYAVHRLTEADEFSPLEPLAFHEDWIVGGGTPEQLRLIGIGGGDIAASEYRIALALGIRVGLVVGSGGAADELLADPHWVGTANLAPLSDEAALKAFLK